MRCKTVATLLLIIGGIQFCLPQTYVVKFKSEMPDSATIYSQITSHLGKGKTSAVLSSAISISPVLRNPKSNFPWAQYAVVRFSSATDLQIIQSISDNPSVEYIHSSVTYRVQSVPTDSAYPSQWNLRRIGISTLFETDVINAALHFVKVGVIDTGVKTDHPDLTLIIETNGLETGIDSFGNDKKSNGIDDDGNGFIDDWQGFDFVDGTTEDVGDWRERDNDPSDEHGHGTMVAGVIGAQMSNGIGVCGIAPATILPLRAFGKNGNGSDIDIASAIVYAVDNGAEVINMSFGDVVRSPIMHDAIRYAFDHNVLLVASSGNDGSSLPHYPSDFTEVISVGSVGRFDSRSFFSAHSPSLDLMAPGEEIVTTTFDGGYTNNFSGTSAAAPHVTGVAAIIKSIEYQKRDAQPNYVPLSNEEIRGILLNSADDAGFPGWDELYGAGIVNAEKAVRSVAGSTVVIHSPKVDEILPDNFMNIVVTAATPYLKSVSLYYGTGENPAEWQLISTIENKILMNDTIQYLSKELLPSDVYILRLVARNSRGNDVEYRQRISIERDQPRIRSLKFRDSVIVGNEYGALVEINVDRNCFGTLLYRRVGEIEYERIQSAGVQKNHSFVLTTKEFQRNVQYEFYCEVTEHSPQRRSTKFYVTDSIGSPVLFSPQSISTTGFEKKSFSLPAGFLLNSVQHISNTSSLLLNEYDADGNFGFLKAFVFNGISFTQKDSSPRLWIPRAFTNGAILVQDRGISQLLRVDTLDGAFFRHTVWGDSSDVWGSQLIDLDDDALPEIIARSSTQYLIYKNNGSNNFSLAATLPNPSAPLPGDAQNQFGPPRSLVGDFTKSGRKEILFADYDGDLIMYRQTNSASLDFNLAGIDSTGLFEMSDFMTLGDFNGDGILDIVVAGHSNPDLNGDREYDTPVWTVRVFSHRASDPAGSLSKIWEQHFVGVKAGSGYDNGIISGKLKPEDTNDALFLSFNPYMYIFTWNPVQQTFESQWIHSSQSNSAVIFDFDDDGINDIGFHTNGKTEFWTLENSSIGVRTPWALSATPLSETKVHLRWNSTVTTHKIYRGGVSNSLTQIATAIGTEWTDTTVVQGIPYFYAVSATATSESQQSNSVEVIPHAASSIINVVQLSRFQVTIELSFDLSTEHLFNAEFVIDDSISSSSTVWKAPRKLLVTFSQAIRNGSRAIRIRNLVDISGMKGNTTQRFFFTAQIPEIKDFFVRSVSLSGKNAISVEFNDQPDFTQAILPSNYSVRNTLKTFPVSRIDSLSPTSVRLVCSDNVGLSAIALRIEITLNANIGSSSGVKLMEGKGQILSIAQEMENIDNIVVYPNPVRNSRQVSFVNIPSNCRITIFSPGGEKIKIFNDVTTTEGISWNLIDERGNQLSSGVYLYRVEKLDAGGGVTHTTLGKFAIVR